MFQAVRTTVAGSLLLAMLTSAPTTAQIIAPVTPVTPVGPVVPIGPIVIIKPCVPNANPAAFLVSPGQGDTVRSRTVKLTWCSDSTTVPAGRPPRTVQIQLSRSSTFAAGAEDTVIGGLREGTIVLPDRQDSLTITLPSAGIWYWRIRTLLVPTLGGVTVASFKPWSDTSSFVSAPPGIVLPTLPGVILPIFRIICRNDTGPRTFSPAARASVAPGTVRFQWCLDSGSVNPLPSEDYERWELQIVGAPKPDTLKIQSRVDTASVFLPGPWTGFKWRVRKTGGFKGDPAGAWSPWSEATLDGRLSVRTSTARLDGFRPTSAALVSASGRTLATYALAGDLPESATLSSWSRNVPSASFVALKDHSGDLRTVPLQAYGVER